MSTNRFHSLLSDWTNDVFGARINSCLRYLHHRGHLPNLKEPKDMSEILLSQLFNPDQKLVKEYAPFIDKIKVRDYIKSKGFEHILLKHYGEWSSPEEIPFDELPSSFVLKSNNSCGHHVICPDKSILDINMAIKTLHEAIKSGQENIEPHYHFITPRVFAEELIETGDGSWPIDYKFTCIGGEIVDVFVAVDRADNLKYCTFDLNWNPLPYMKEAYRPIKLPRKPEHLAEMIDVAKSLSSDFNFVRVDLYEYREQPFFSELTFFPWGGLLYGYTNEALVLYGAKWQNAMRD